MLAMTTQYGLVKTMEKKAAMSICVPSEGCTDTGIMCMAAITGYTNTSPSPRATRVIIMT